MQLGRRLRTGLGSLFFIEFVLGGVSVRRTILVLILCVIIIAVLVGLGFLKIPNAQIVYSAVSGAMFIGFGYLLKRCEKDSTFRRFFSMRGIRLRNVPILLCSLVILISGSFILNYAVSRLCELMGISESASGGLPEISSGNYLLMIFFIAVIPSVFEELFFRGAVLSFLSQKGVVYSVVVSALFFTMVHGLDYYFISTFFAGAVLAVSVHLTSSVYTAMIIHFANNIMSYILSVYSERLRSLKMDVYLLYALGFIFLIGLYFLLSSVIYGIKHPDRRRRISAEEEVLDNGGEKIEVK